MDPISAAGIGLSVTSLALQVFSGCVTAYQLFLEAEGMPQAYQFLRVRLRFEQTRLLRWGEKIGLAEELLEEPGRALQLNRNLIFDMLLEIQALFKQTIKIQSKYDKLVPEKSLPQRDPLTAVKGSEDRFLKKTLKVLQRAPEAPQRLQWALVKHDKFKGLVEKLIGYNDAIEGLLETGALEQLLHVQRETYMSILQLNNKVDDLKEISLAMQVQRASPSRATTLGSNDIRLIEVRQQDDQDFHDLASFKAQQNLMETDPSTIKPLDASTVALRGDTLSRCEATVEGQEVWIEWKELDDDNENSHWEAIITQRVQNLVALLKSPNKSPYFRAPDCLGYFLDQSTDGQRFGFVYTKPSTIAASTPCTSLLSQILTQPRPSLTQRMALAHALARSLMYFHSVNWLHKGFRSSNVVFFSPPPVMGKVSYASPIISGFEYARIDQVDELTEALPEYTENDVYRHPQVLSSAHVRSKKSHDIYSLGILLIEIAHWQSIKALVKLPEDERRARKVIRGMREMLLGDTQMDDLEGLVGDSFAGAVKICLQGLVAPNADEEDPVVGAQLQQIFHDEVVARLSSVNA